MNGSLEEGYRQLLRSGEVRHPWVAYQFVYELIQHMTWEGGSNLPPAERQSNPTPERIVEAFVRETQGKFGVFVHSVLNHWQLNASRDLGTLVLQLEQVGCLTFASGEDLERFASASWLPGSST